MRVVRQPIKKIDGLALVTGKPVYTEDLVPVNTLTVKILRSPYAYARIKSIDVSRAEAIDGVECVFTYKDVPQVRFTLAGQSSPEPSPYDRLILDEYVRYVGDEVAIVAAVDEKTAIRAMSAIKVEYEVLEPVLNYEEAIDHSSMVHQEEVHCNYDIGMERQRNILSTHDASFGDLEEEMGKCPVVVEETYYTQAQAHAMMETFRAFTNLDAMGRLVVTSSTQIPFHVRRHLAKALDIPASKIRVIKPRIGGGFGGKQTASVEVFPALVTWKTGKPSMIVYDRKETFSSTTSRHAMRVSVKLGADEQGNILAADIRALSDTGAYGEHGPTTIRLVGEKTLPLFKHLKGARYSAHVVYTNKLPGGALRGYGATQGCFAVESAVNKLAHQLGMDPVQLRQKNLVGEGETTFAYNKHLESCALNRCIETGKKLIGWEEKYPRVQVSPEKVRAVGMAVTMQGSGIAGIDTASAEIRLNDTGDYTLLVGSTDMGTGSDTILAQIAAEVLDTAIEEITVHTADTDVSPFDPGSYASSTAYVTGMAVFKAAQELRNKIIAQAAQHLEVAKDEVEFDGRDLRAVGSERVVSLPKLAADLVAGPNRAQLVGVASHGSPVSPPPFMAGFAEVEVDKETGKVTLIDYVGVVDCGTVINPSVCRVQAEGGIVQGIGMALFEDVRYTQRGKLSTNSFLQYKIPSRKDVGNIRVVFEESYEPTGPFGAKSIGEIVINTPPPAIADAVFNAVGVRITSLPITPEKVLNALNDKKSGE